MASSWPQVRTLRESRMGRSDLRHHNQSTLAVWVRSCTKGRESLWSQDTPRGTLRLSRRLMTPFDRYTGPTIARTPSSRNMNDR